ncbi:MAG: hypothetical protein HXY43_08085 [Fischerella sp.]|uniref:hypothetical protein n=1 Tax=Fischerella sp. TaxID=1191 RepID=UPI00184D7DEF|nr:hypothetical protein [Fischerella sp.]NWF59252.1 hypothetical protein [Fischerella sp.]
MAKNGLENLDQDARVRATSKIWGITAGILAICIPLSAVTRSGPILPLAAIAGAAVGTVAVWRSDDQKSRTNYLQPQQLQKLEQRIENLETIVSSNDFDLQRKIKQLEPSESAGLFRDNGKAQNQKIFSQVSFLV